MVKIIISTPILERSETELFTYCGGEPCPECPDRGNYALSSDCDYFELHKGITPICTRPGNAQSQIEAWLRDTGVGGSIVETVVEVRRADPTL